MSLILLLLHFIFLTFFYRQVLTNVFPTGALNKLICFWFGYTELKLLRSMKEDPQSLVYTADSCQNLIKARAEKSRCDRHEHTHTYACLGAADMCVCGTAIKTPKTDSEARSVIKQSSSKRRNKTNTTNFKLILTHVWHECST